MEINKIDKTDIMKQCIFFKKNRDSVDKSTKPKLVLNGY